MQPDTHEALRRSLVTKLQDHYGLQEEEALTKVDAWLKWITEGTQSNAND
jgi:hypothetical protein